MAFVTRFSLHLGVVVFLGVVLLFGAGIFAATQVQQDLLPDISVPAVIVITPYPGASPEVVDQQVSVPVGNAMQGVAGGDTQPGPPPPPAPPLVVPFNDATPPKTPHPARDTPLVTVRAPPPPPAPPPPAACPRPPQSWPRAARASGRWRPHCSGRASFNRSAR